MFRTQEQQDRAVEAARYEAAKRDCIAAVYAARQDFVRCEANDRQIISMVERWTGNLDVLPTKAIFEEAILENPEAINGFARQGEVVTRQQLSEQIISLLRAKGKGHDDFTLRQEEKRLAMLSIPALRARLADLQTKARMAVQPIGDLKKIVQDARPDYSQWPQLPKSVWNGTAHVPLDAAQFKSMDAWEI